VTESRTPYPVRVDAAALHSVMHAPCPVLGVHRRPNGSAGSAARSAVSVASVVG